MSFSIVDGISYKRHIWSNEQNLPWHVLFVLLHVVIQIVLYFDCSMNRILAVQTLTVADLFTSLSVSKYDCCRFL